MALILLAVLVATWTWPILWDRLVSRAVTVKVEVLTRAVNKGEKATFQCILTNTSRLPCPRVRCAVVLPPQLHSGNPDRQGHLEITTYLLPRQRTVATFQATARQRGLGRLAQVNVTLTDGLGIRKHYRSFATTVGVVVRPDQNPALPVSRRLLDLVGALRTQRFYNEDPSLLLGIRQYQDGDPLRYVSWYATASHQQLMVKQFGYTTSSRCMIVINGYSGELKSDEAFNLLCSRVVHVSEQMLAAGLSVGLYTNMFDSVTRTFIEPPSASAAQLEHIRTRMGSIEAIPFSSVAHLIQSIPQFTDQGDLVVIMTTYMDPQSSDALRYLKRSRQNVHLYVLRERYTNVPAIPGVTTYVEDVSGDQVG